MDIFLFTNGTLLNEQKNKILLDSNITRLFVSLDAATNNTYQKVRIPVSKNVQNIISIKSVIRIF